MIKLKKFLIEYLYWISGVVFILSTLWSAIQVYGYLEDINEERRAFVEKDDILNQFWLDRDQSQHDELVGLLNQIARDIAIHKGEHNVVMNKSREKPTD